MLTTYASHIYYLCMSSFSHVTCSYSMYIIYAVRTGHMAKCSHYTIMHGSTKLAVITLL